MPATHLATFNVDATVPLGHGLCGGWIKPVVEVDTPLLCLGVVLLGDEAAVVLAAVDWTGICNDAHTQFTQAIAEAAHTTPERVAVHARPSAQRALRRCHRARRLVSEHKDLPASCDLAWFAELPRPRRRRHPGALAQDRTGHARDPRPGEGGQGRQQPPHHSGPTASSPAGVPASARTPSSATARKASSTPGSRRVSLLERRQEARRLPLLRHASR